MDSLSRILLLGIAGVVAGGCLHSEQTLVLQPDGSGTLSVAYAVPTSTLRMMGESEDMQFDEARIRQEFTEKAVPGVDLLAVKVKHSDAGQAMGLKIGFEELADLARTEFYRESRLSLERTDTGTYRFTQMANAPRRDPRGADELRLMQGFRFTMTIAVPGPIVDSNADAIDRHTARWRFDLDTDPNAIARMDAMVYEIEFRPEAPGLPEYRRPRVRLHPPPLRPEPLAGEPP